MLFGARSRSLVRANRLPLSREDRGPMSAYVAPTDWRLLRLVLRQQSGRDKEVDVGVHLTKRDASRFKAWHAGLLAVLLAMALGGIRSGASWGASAYDPSADLYSMQNVTAGEGGGVWLERGGNGQSAGGAAVDP